MTYEQACAFLYSLERRGVRLGLDRIVGAFRDHGDPQESFGSILVGGTNGKGSVCVLAASCLQAAGYRTGLFTSPHLVDFRERMRLDGWMVSREEIVDLTTRIRGSIERWHLSFFEATTLMAFLWFRERGAEVAAVEVGLGGRLDATRPVRALATVVTTVGLDHVRILGPTYRAIAGEKAGIFRRGSPAVVGSCPPEALEVLRRRADEVGAPLHERRRSLRITRIGATPSGSRFDATALAATPGPSPRLPLEIGLKGHHQVANAALALLSLVLLPESFRVDRQALQVGMRRARWPGRCEEVRARPRVVCDVAHNLEGARALASTLARSSQSGFRLVAGMLEGKDHASFLETIRPRVGAAHYCTPPTDRALPAQRLASIGASVGLEGAVHATPAEALEAAIAEAGREGAVLVTGSLFTVGAIYRHLDLAPVDPLWEAETACAGGGP